MCLCTPFGADTVYRYGDWTLGVVSGSDDYAFSIRSYDGDDAVVTVPDDYGGYPIITIEAYAFATNMNVQQVILNDQIVSIGTGAFSQCENLNRIDIPDTVTRIGDDACQGCDQVVIYASSDSYAIAYAEDHGINYVCTDAETYILGDADGNGTIEVIDVTVIQRFLAGIPVADPDIVERNGDVDGDGLNITDATFIQRYLASMETPYEIGETMTINN